MKIKKDYFVFPDDHPTFAGKIVPTEPVKTPMVNTWWVRTCNRKCYFLRQIHDFFGQPYVWIYEDGVDRCLHLPLAAFRRSYRQLDVGPVDPETGNTLHHLN